MYDYENILSKEEFRYWFKRIGVTDAFEVFDPAYSDTASIGTYHQHPKRFDECNELSDGTAQHLIDATAQEVITEFSKFENQALRKNLCKFINCDKNVSWEWRKICHSNFLQYTMDTVICQDTLAISMLEWSIAEWKQADSRQLSQACRDT